MGSNGAGKRVLGTSGLRTPRARRGKGRGPLTTIEHGIHCGVARVDKPVIPTIVPATGNEREVVDRGQDKGAMIRTSGGVRRAGSGRRWQWCQCRK